MLTCNRYNVVTNIIMLVNSACTLWVITRKIPSSFISLTFKNYRLPFISVIPVSSAQKRLKTEDISLFFHFFVMLLSLIGLMPSKPHLLQFVFLSLNILKFHHTIINRFLLGLPLTLLFPIENRQQLLKRIYVGIKSSGLTPMVNYFSWCLQLL